jgi:hypothetical protein
MLVEGRDGLVTMLIEARANRVELIGKKLHPFTIYSILFAEAAVPLVLLPVRRSHDHTSLLHIRFFDFVDSIFPNALFPSSLSHLLVLPLTFSSPKPTSSFLLPCI